MKKMILFVVLLVSIVGCKDREEVVLPNGDKWVSENTPFWRPQEAGKNEWSLMSAIFEGTPEVPPSPQFRDWNDLGGVQVVKQPIVDKYQGDVYQFSFSYKKQMNMISEPVDFYPGSKMRVVSVKLGKYLEGLNLNLIGKDELLLPGNNLKFQIKSVGNPVRVMFNANGIKIPAGEEILRVLVTPTEEGKSPAPDFDPAYIQMKEKIANNLWEFKWNISGVTERYPIKQAGVELQNPKKHGLLWAEPADPPDGFFPLAIWDEENENGIYIKNYTISYIPAAGSSGAPPSPEMLARMGVTLNEKTYTISLEYQEKFLEAKYQSKSSIISKIFTPTGKKATTWGNIK